MKKIDRGQTVSILTNLGVIAGIVFLGIEIQQNNELMVNEAERARAESIRESFVLLAENGELAAIYFKELEGEELSDLEEFRLGQFSWRGIVGYQTSFHQLPREDLEPYANFFRSEYDRSSSFRAAWQRYEGTLDPLFVQFMEENVTGGP